MQRIIYDLRSLVLMQEGTLTEYLTFDSQQGFTDFLQTDIDTALTSMYQLHGNISLSTLDMKDEHWDLFSQKQVPLYYQDNTRSLERLNFSLNEAMLQVKSAIFTVRHFNLSQYEERQEDLYFVTYNSFNDLLIALRNSSRYFVEETINRTEQRGVLILVIYLASIGTLLMAIMIMMPVVSKVNAAREKVLSLFLDIPPQNVQALIFKCQKFLETFNDEEWVEEADSDEEGFQNKTEVEQEFISGNKVRGRNNLNDNRSSNWLRLFMKFAISALCVQSYFMLFYILAKRGLNDAHSLSYSMNLYAQAEQYYSFAFNAQRELVYNASKEILDIESFQVSKDSISDLYNLNNMIQEIQVSNEKI
mmetsp:Transcript_1048/g.1032  ORF Transcript_1048/g.1032 Transcript_1048/m.1032 type:complete len:362 (+) Transcript_1048:203-1288(+)